MISSLCKELHVDKEHVFLSRVPLDMSFVFGIQSYLKNTAQEKLFYQRRTPRMTPQLDDKSPLIPQILKKDVLLCNGIQQCGKNAEEREKRKIK